MKTLRQFTLSLAALGAVLFFNSTTAFAQTCTDSSACTTPHAPVCDGNTVVRFSGGSCADTNHDGSLNQCVYDSTRIDCGSSNRCHAGQCIPTTVRADAPDTPQVCEGVTITPPACSGANGTWSEATEVNGGCSLQSNTITCGAGTICVANDEVAYCEDAGPTLIVAQRPTSEIGTDGNPTWDEWTRATVYLAEHAYTASQNACSTQTEGREHVECELTLNFLNSGTTVEQRIAIVRARLQMGR